MVGLSYLRSLAKLWKRPRIAKLRVEVNQRLTSSVARCITSRNVIELSPAAARRGAQLQREMRSRLWRVEDSSQGCKELPEWQLVRMNGERVSRHGNMRY
jgi:hypothetical protein